MTPLTVVGDALLDVDLRGDARRLAPDAPVPVVDDLSEVARPGGAGLAAVLAAADGRPVTLVTALADDASGERLRALLAGAGVRVLALPRPGETVVKRRVLAGGHVLLRLDEGSHAAPSGVPEEARAAVREARALLVSDYGGGLADALRDPLAAAARRVPLVWDPHPRGGPPVPGARLATPNRAEAAGFAARTMRSTDLTGLRGTTRQAEHLLRQWSSDAVAVTLGARGALLARSGLTPALVPAPPVRSDDPCGAGDRFAATAAGALADGLEVDLAVAAAVTEASAYVARGGASGLSGPTPPETVSRLEQVRARGGTVVATGGCFDLLHAGHVATLEAARRMGDCLVVCLNSDRSVRLLKGPGRPVVTQDDRARVLLALSCVDDVVVFDEDTPEQLLRRLQPDVWVKGGDYDGSELPEARVLPEWGGQVVTVPFLEGRSTTGIVRSIGIPPRAEDGDLRQSG